MITTKHKLAEQVLLRLGKDMVEAEPDIRELILSVQQSLGNVVRKRFFEAKNYDVGEIDGALVYTFKNIDIQYDTDTEQYYSTLPAGTITLPHGIGLKLVAPMKGLSRKEVNGGYRPVPNGFNDLYSGLASSRLENMVGYYKENDKIYYVNMDGLNKPTGVMMKMIVPLDGIDEDANINIPADIQEEIIEIVFSKYAAASQLQKDNNSDNLDQA